MSKFLRLVRMNDGGRVPATVIATALLGLLAAGCSSDMTRFDFPAFGLTDANPRSKPVPAEPVFGNKVADADGGSYGQSYDGGQSYDSSYGSGYDSGVSRESPDYGGYGPSEKRYDVTGLPATKGGGGIDGDEYLAGNGGAYGDDPAALKGHKPAYSGNGDSVVVQPGDTIYRIARKHGVSVAALMAENNMASPSISVGMRLVLPGRDGGVRPVKQAKLKNEAYSSDALPGANGDLSDANPYEEGSAADQQEPAVYVPAVKAPALKSPSLKSSPNKDLLTKAGTYKVRSGDTFASIARALGVSQKSLAEANDVADTSKLKEGQVLHMPGAGYDSIDSASDPYGSLKAEKAAALDQSANDPVAKDDEVARPAAKPKKPKVVAALDRKPVVGEAEAASNSGDGFLADEAATAPVKPAVQKPVVKDEPAAVADGAADSPVATKKDKVAKADPAVAADEAGNAGDDAKSADAAGSGFRWPVRGRIVSKFGKLEDGSQNDGINVAVPLGTDVHAAEEGTVAYAGSELKGFGNLVLVRHADNWVTAYAHNQSILVKRGDKVTRGQVIAKAGKSGSVDQPQVHFELRKGSRPVDPLPHMASN